MENNDPKFIDSSGLAHTTGVDGVDYPRWNWPHQKPFQRTPGTQGSHYRSLFMRVFPALGRYLAVTETEHFRRWNTYLGVRGVIVVGVLWVSRPPSHSKDALRMHRCLLHEKCFLICLLISSIDVC